MKLPLAIFLSAALAGSASVVVAAPGIDAPINKREAAAAWSAEGLRPVGNTRLDLVYARGDADLSVYRSVHLAPVDVAFQHQWERRLLSNTGTRIRPTELSQIKQDVADAVHDQVARELAKGGLQVVDTGGPGVVEIELRVVELYLNAPDLPTVNLTRNYARSFGEMTLVAELRDGGSGALLMRSLDRTLGRDFGQFRRFTRVENSMEVGSVASDWARALRKELDLAKPISQS